MVFPFGYVFSSLGASSSPLSAADALAALRADMLSRAGADAQAFEQQYGKRRSKRWVKCDPFSNELGCANLANSLGWFVCAREDS